MTQIINKMNKTELNKLKTLLIKFEKVAREDNSIWILEAVPISDTIRLVDRVLEAI